MTDIHITKINESWMKVKCTEIYMELDLSDEFSFKIPGAEFDPRVKYGKWDGIKRLYNRKTSRMYVGLLFQLLKVAEAKGWSTYVDPDLMPSAETLEEEDLQQLVELFNPHSKGEPIDLYDYQSEAILHMMGMDRSVCVAATAAGKSLILYVAARIYQLLDELANKRIFIVVPNISLVEQLYSDFEDYSNFPGNSWHVSSNCQKISGKYTKQLDRQIIITTWQSMIKMPHYIYEDLGAIFIDETHLASGASLTNILEQCTDTPYRHGLTGTLDGTQINELTIQGLLGPAKRIVTAKEIIDQGRASDIEVHMSLLDYPQSIRQELAKEKAKIPSKARQARFQKEVEFINDISYRRQFISEMIKSFPGNSLVLFDRVDSYGKEIYEAFKEHHENTFLLVGEVGAEEREKIRVSMEEYDDAVIFASYQVAQAGMSIKKLNNLFLISSSKSIVRILQSLGRLMRLHESKDIARIFDIVDDMTFDGKENYMMLHAQERIKMYSKEQFKIKFDKYDMRKYVNVNQSIDQYLS
jgi:superfamily II DNA or RNA helicase